VPLCVAETSDGSHMNTADFIAAGCATYVRTSANHRGGSPRDAHGTCDAFRLRAEPTADRAGRAPVHGDTELHLLRVLVTSNPVVREPRVGADGLVRAPTERHCIADFVAEAREHAGIN